MTKGKYIFDDRDIAAANWMFGLIKNLNPMFKAPRFEAWASEIRLMRERDGRSYKDIATVFTWANQDQFWCSNILSPKALRKQFDRLLIQMKMRPGQAQTERLKKTLTQNYAEFRLKYGNSKAPRP
jgi:hypothetical protein